MRLGYRALPGVTYVLLFGCLPVTAWGQAWLPARGTGSVNLSYQFGSGGDHLFSTDSIDGESTRGYVAEGNRWFLGDLYVQTVVASVEYGVFDWLAINAAIPYVITRYDGRAPVDLETDDGEYHGSFQDFGFLVRAQVLDGPLALTPFVGCLMPTTQYANGGHASIGRRLLEFQAGLFAGRDLAPLVSDAYVHGAFIAGFDEDIDNLDIWRSSFDVELGYFVTPSFSVFGLVGGLWTHGGLDWVTDDPGEQSGHGNPFFEFTVSTVAARNTRVGGGLSVSLPRSLHMSVVYSSTVWGENVDDFNIATVSMGYAFDLWSAE